MINQISEKLLMYIKFHLSIDDEMDEVYKYGIEITLSSLLNVILILLLAAIIGDVNSGVTFLLCIILVRSYCGGYHASTYFRCNLVFVLTFLFVYYFSMIISTLNIESRFVVCASVIIISYVPVIMFSPVKNIHKQLTEEKANKCRIISIILFAACGVLSLLLIGINSNRGATLTMTLAAISIMIVVEIFMQRRDYHESE